ncbi:MAG: hypothetical protein JKX76_00570 [Colwellia sp.]|nr:hypothetical protein [Colwellia sp.]
MNENHIKVLLLLENELNGFLQRVPPPQIVHLDGSPTYRFKEESVLQAIIQKLARVISGLYSSHLLSECGFLQEQAAIHRMLDEFNQDIIFLSFAEIDGKITDLHIRYLKAFFEEEFDNPSDPLASTQKRGGITRKKIHSYIAQRDESGLNPSDGINVQKTLSKSYSGYVHGASPQIMEMYSQNPSRFIVSGMLGTPLQSEHRDDFTIGIYRSIVSFVLSAKAFGNEESIVRLLHCKHEFEKKFDVY